MQYSFTISYNIPEHPERAAISLSTYADDQQTAEKMAKAKVLSCFKEAHNLKVEAMKDYSA